MRAMTVTTPLGQVRHDDGGTRLEFVRQFPTDIAGLWSAITDPDRCAHWFGSWTGDPATGAVQLLMTAEDDASAQDVTIVECEEPTRLVVELPAPDGTWRLELDLSTDDDSSRLVFTQPLADPDEATNIGPGWHYYLDRLAAEVAGSPVPDDWSTYEPLASRYP